MLKPQANARAEGPLRPTLSHRMDYVPRHPSEQFIVPLLRAEIETCFAMVGNALQRGAKALDVGCGRQPFRRRIRELGFTYVGLDVQQNAEKSVDILGAIDAPIPKGLTELGPFDFILCTEVMEHVADWHMAFSNMTSLLRSGGLLLLTAPHFYPLHEQPFDFWRPTTHAIATYARCSGLTAEYWRAAGDGWDVLGTLLASCGFEPQSESLLDRVLNSLCWRMNRIVVNVLACRVIQRRVKATGALYLSNVFLLRKS